MMSKKGKRILLVIFIAICIMLLLNSNIVHAEINHSYIGVDTVPDEGLDQAFDGSEMIKQLARLIYVVGRWLEWLLGTIFRMLTGVLDFPWADKIVFNAVPLLDVNFINPAQRSFVLNIQEVLKGLYSTMLTLAIGFFGIAVLITAIKLVVSSIASEKAKYKKAVVDWLVGFVMIFCIHYFISFTFYLNEQLVKVASNIITKQLENADKVAKVKRQTVVQEIIDEARIKGYTYNGELIADILDNNYDVVFAWVNYTKSNDTSKGIHEALMKNMILSWDAAKTGEQQYKNLALVVKWAVDKNVSVYEIQQMRTRVKLLASVIYDDYDNKDVIGSVDGVSEAVAEEDLKKLLGGYYVQFMEQIFNKEFKDLNPITCGEWVSDNKILVRPDPYGTNQPAATTPGTTKNYYISDITNKADETNEFYQLLKKYGAESIITANGSSGRFYWSEVLDEMIILKSFSNTSNSGEENEGVSSNYKVRIISDLASYFRENSFNKVRENKTGLKNGKNIQIQNMIMYSILVGQSLILFISYIKRLFYVIMLAMLAPIVVVVDFFQKFGK